jgi:glycine cleavage system H lipoate-binding protein/ABC-type phosphate transport system substrate-binding protein
MKTRIFIFISLLLLYFFKFGNDNVVAQEKATSENTISIVSTPALFSLANDWANEYAKLNPELKIKVTKLSEQEMLKSQKAEGDFYFVANDPSDFWKISIGKDVLIPVINSKNPFLAELKNHNISEVVLAEILLAAKDRKWHIVPKTGKNVPINYYMVDDATDKSVIEKFLSAHQDIEGIRVDNYEKLITSVMNDPYSIGFCKLSILMNINIPGIEQKISIMPIDRNSNGKVDHFENNYSDLQTFMRKAWIGKFPDDLTAGLYLAAAEKPTGQAELDFLKWVSTDGQIFMNQNAYATLVSAEIQSNLAMLGMQKVQLADTETVADSSKIAQFFASISVSQYIFGIFILSLIILGFVLNYSPRDKGLSKGKAFSQQIFNENMINAPSGLLYDKTHTWAFMEKDGMVRVGIDDFLQHVTGPLTKVKMKNPGDQVKKGEPVLSIIQNGKLLNINSPVSGTIVAQNEILTGNPSAINESPYASGWVYMIKPSNWAREIQFFHMADKYQEWIKTEFTRLKDFLAETIHSKNPAYAQVVLQDGGVIKDHVLADFGPDVWEEFQTNFVDIKK